MLYRIFLIAAAGALGTLARYSIGLLAARALPWPSLVVNTTGSFTFGFIWSLANQRLLISPQNQLIVLVGFMGAFTTFSSYIFESCHLLQQGQWATGLLNVLLQNALGVGVLFLGMWCARSV